MARTLRKQKGPLNPRAFLFDSIGAANRNRTYDLLITNQLLYQLSYCGVSGRGRLRAHSSRVARWDKPCCGGAQYLTLQP